MALLNYGLKGSEWLDYVKGTTTDHDKYLKLVFTEDGHIITHGTDYLPTFDISTINTIGTEWYKFHRGLLDTSIITNTLDNSNKLVSSAAVLTYLNTTYADAIKAKDFLLFKGVLSSADDLPRSDFKQGDTYRVSSGSGFTINLGGNELARVTTGDIVVCIKDYVEGGTEQYWTVIESNIDGTSTLTFLGNSTILLVASQNVGASISNIVTSKHGFTKGYILQAIDENNADWINPMKSFKVKYAENADIATNVANALSFGDTLTTSDGYKTYDGSSPRTLNVRTATKGTVDKDGNEISESIPGILTVSSNDAYFDITGGVLLLKGDIFESIFGNLNELKYILTTTSVTDPSGVLLGIESLANKSYVKLLLGDNIKLNTSNEDTPTITISAQHREISIGGVSIGNKPLNFTTVPLGSIGIVANINDLNNTTETFDIGFDLYWHNLSTNNYEA